MSTGKQSLTSGNGTALELVGESEGDLGLDVVLLALQNRDNVGAAAPDLIGVFGLLEVAVGRHLEFAVTSSLRGSSSD